MKGTLGPLWADFWSFLANIFGNVALTSPQSFRKRTLDITGFKSSLPKEMYWFSLLDSNSQFFSPTEQFWISIRSLFWNRFLFRIWARKDCIDTSVPKYCIIWFFYNFNFWQSSLATIGKGSCLKGESCSNKPFDWSKTLSLYLKFPLKNLFIHVIL